MALGGWPVALASLATRVVQLNAPEETMLAAYESAIRADIHLARDYAARPTVTVCGAVACCADHLADGAQAWAELAPQRRCRGCERGAR